MNILLTGANGYIGMRLLPVLLDQGHHVTCLVRDRRRFPSHRFEPEATTDPRLAVVEGDLLDPDSLPRLPGPIDAAYYLVHSMGSGKSNFFDLEERSARNFLRLVENAGSGDSDTEEHGELGGRDSQTTATGGTRVIYLSGIVNHPKAELSPHLASRLNVEEILHESAVPTTVLRAAIIVGAGSASFEIIRDLVEKLPVMIAPKWLRSPCQPIAVRNVIDYLTGVLETEETAGQTFDIAGPEAYSYAEILRMFAEVRGLNRVLVPVPFLTPRLSSYWLYFMTTTSYPLARSLVDSLSYDMSASETRIREFVPVDLIPYPDAVRRAFSMIEQNQVKSSWIDSISSGRMDVGFLRNIEVPGHGVSVDRRVVPFDRDPDEVVDNFWRIGGDQGWYSMDWAWKLRGWIDRLFGGAGLRRGRRDPEELHPGDALDFWRVLAADRERRRLILFAEMKLPGEAWLEFRVEPVQAGPESDPTSAPPWRLVQTATFRPRGLLGRAYWWLVLPFHHFVFTTMAREIVERKSPEKS